MCRASRYRVGGMAYLDRDGRDEPGHDKEHYPPAALASPWGRVNSASSGRLIAACRVGVVILSMT